MMWARIISRWRWFVYTVCVLLFLQFSLWHRGGRLSKRGFNATAIETFVRFQENFNDFAILTKKPPEPKKILILTYFRTGSTFLSEVISNHPDVFFVFEPMRGIYWGMSYDEKHFDRHYHRLRGNEKQVALKQLEDVMNCKFNLQNPDFFSSYHDFLQIKGHPPLDDFKTCLKNASQHGCLAELCSNIWYGMCTRQTPLPDVMSCFTMEDLLNSVKPEEAFNEASRTCVNYCPAKLRECIGIISRKCISAPIRATKTIRLGMDMVDDLLAKNPDMKIIHNIRDPRGMVSSQLHFNSMKPHDNAEWFCSRVLLDLNLRDQLEKKHPNTFMSVTYESLSLNLTSTIRKIYDHLQLKVPPEVTSFMHDISHNKHPRKKYGEWVRNSTAHVYEWRRKTSKEMQKTIISVPACRKLVKRVYGEKQLQL